LAWLVHVPAPLHFWQKAHCPLVNELPEHNWDAFAYDGLLAVHAPTPLHNPFCVARVQVLVQVVEASHSLFKSSAAVCTTQVLPEHL
jgi:hypothetical protein